MVSIGIHISVLPKDGVLFRIEYEKVVRVIKVSFKESVLCHKGVVGS